MLELQGHHVNERVYESKTIAVYRGMTQSDHCPVIIKVLKAKYPTRQALERFEYGYRIAKFLRLPGVIKPYSLENIGHSKAMVMEDFGAVSLADYMRDYVVDIRESLEIALSVTNILGEVHQRSVVHKAITPFNILINPTTKKVKITDFSIAIQLEEEKKEGEPPSQLEGTLAYIAPEQTGRMNRVVDFRSDYYSLGVVFYEMLTGGSFFSVTDSMEMVYAHMAQQPVAPKELVPGIPETLSDIAMKLLAKNAEDRY